MMEKTIRLRRLASLVDPDYAGWRRLGICDRDAAIAFRNGIEYVNKHYDVTLQYEQMKCEYTEMNDQCIKERCPFYEGHFNVKNSQTDKKCFC
jgi:hypothetical protein